MAAQKRFEEILEKLFQESPTATTTATKSKPNNSNNNNNNNRNNNDSSASTTTTTTTSSVDRVQWLKGKKRPNFSSALGVPGPKSRINPVEEMQVLSGSSVSVQAPSCRPWDRGDLFRRLSTFKSMTWFAKPQTVSAVNCARRGWINVDMDIIACESCGARLLFSTPSSWTQQQVEKAALVFSLKLDTGHKLLCPWVDNICDEKLAEFPPKPTAVLVDDYKKRCSALLQLSALPIISSSAIDYISSPQLEEFLGGPSGVEKNKSADASRSLLNKPPSASSASYYQAQKLISLFGWEFHSLPYIVDCKVGKEDSSNNVNLANQPHPASDKHNLSVICSSTKGMLEAVNDSQASETVLYEPNSVVFECKLCGASVGLWAFSSVPQPIEFLRLVGYTEVGGQNDTPQSTNTAPGSSFPSNEGRNDFVASTSSNEETSTLNLTIAGGPPPAKQNYRAIISLPVIGRNLRARFSSDYMVNKDQEMPLVEGNTSQQANDQVGEPVSDNEKQLQNVEAVGGGLGSADILVKNVGSTETVDSVVEDINWSQVGEFSSSNVENNVGMVVETAICKNDNLPGDKRSDNAVESGGPAGDSNVPRSSLGRNLEQVSPYNSMEFDPIRQHRLFCPWIASFGNSTPGWKQTLSALQRHKEFSGSFSENPLSSLIEVDDPIASVRKLFSSPPVKRMKHAHAS